MTKRIKPIINDDGSNSKDSNNLTFCMAPWTHTFLSPQGERRMCCTSREQSQFQKQYIDSGTSAQSSSFKPKTLEEHWNSEYMCSIRKKLLAGETLTQCEICNSDRFNANNYRKWFNLLFKDKIDDVFANTSSDGKTTMNPVSFDYRVSNLCNFKCRMCGELFSSSIEAEKKKHNMWSAENQPFMEPSTKKMMQQFQTSVAEVEFKEAIKSGTVEEIYWAGGEPLMFDTHWWAMEYMTSHNLASDCIVRYNTNLSRTTYKGMKLYEYLSEFKDWQICASIDGVGQTVEFIRKGIVWDNWLANFKDGLKLEGGEDRMIIDLTVTGPGMFDLKHLFDLSQELNVRIETKNMFAFEPDIIFSPLAWPRKILNNHIDALLDYMEPLATHKQSSLIRCLHSLKEQPNFEEQWPTDVDDAFKQGKAHQDRLDSIRNEQYTIKDIYAQNDELSRWWNRYD